MRRDKIKQLYEQSRKCTSMTSEEKAAKNNTISTTHKSKCAQIAANNNQFRSAITRVNNNTPVALTTSQTIKIINSLYPKKHILAKQYNSTNKKSKLQPKNCTKEDLIKILTRMLKGKTAKPHVDVTDVIKYMVLHNTKRKEDNPYAETVLQFYEKILKNDIPPSIRKPYNVSFVFGSKKTLMTLASYD